MLKHPTLDKLESLRLFGMAQGLREQESVPVRKIQGLLGHSHLQTTAIYLAHIAPHDLIEVAHNRPAWGLSKQA